MRNTVLMLSLWVCLINPGWPLAAQDGEPESLTALRSRLEHELEKLDKPLRDLNAKYRQYLVRQKADYQEAGNLEAMLAVEKEMKNFGRKRPTVLSSHGELKRLQEIYRGERTGVMAERAKLRLELVKGYGKAASELASQWTKEGKIEEARSALAESKRLGALQTDQAFLNAWPGGKGRPSGGAPADPEVLLPTKIENPFEVPYAHKKFKGPYYIMESDGSKGRLLLEFTHPAFAEGESRLQAATLVMVVGKKGPADTTELISVYAGEEVVGSRQGAAKGEELRIELNPAKLGGGNPVALEVKCGDNAVFVEKKISPHLDVEFH